MVDQEYYPLEFVKEDQNTIILRNRNNKNIEAFYKIDLNKCIGVEFNETMDGESFIKDTQIQMIFKDAEMELRGNCC